MKAEIIHETETDLLQPVQKEMGYLKAGIFGPENSGKSYLAISLAIGAAKQIGRPKVGYYDSEKAVGYAKARVEAAGIQFFGRTTKSFADLCAIVLEAERKEYGALIIDTVTAPWEELCDTWLKSKGRSKLGMDGVQICKRTWRNEFTSLFNNSRLNIILCGRAAGVFDQEEDEDGEMEVQRVGTKMKTEADMGYEPHLLLEMKAARLSPKPGKKRSKIEKKRPRTVQFKCFVWKDKNMDERTTLTGREFFNAKYSDFKPHLDYIELGSNKDRGFRPGLDTREFFENPGRSWEHKARQRKILIEELDALLIKGGLDGRSDKTKLDRTKTLERFFGRSSRTWIEEGMSLGELSMAIDDLRLHLFPPPTPTNGETPLVPAPDSEDAAKAADEAY